MSSERSRLHFLGLRRALRWQAVLVAPLLICLAPLASVAAPGAQPVDSCVDCHSDPDFFVTNRKLYDYFQRWSESIHKQEGVTCVDCHGGDAKSADKERAHGADLEASKQGSAVNFRNIPNTCGECHEDVYDGFRKSAHFEHIVAKKQEDQGPTCVTCHGSIAGSVLDVTTVEETCSRCHNEKSENAPEVPEKARSLLNRFLVIHRYYRYITVRGDPVETRAFFEGLDAKLHDLSVTWHTFDLDEVGAKTEAVLKAVKQKREETARIFKQTRQDRRSGRSASSTP